MAKNWDALFESKIDELKGTVAVLKVGGKSKATQLYQRRRELKTLRLIRTLLDAAGDEVLTKEDVDHLVSLTTLTEERAFTKFEIQAGDSVMDIMERYPKKRDLLKAVNEYCAQHGLRLNTVEMVIEEA